MPFSPDSLSLNLLLGSMSENDRRRILDKGSLISCTQFQVLQHADAAITAVYFPESAWMSLVAVLEGGRTAEVGVAGREGMVGLELLLGGRKASFEWVIQGPGSLLRVNAGDFLRLVEESATLSSTLTRFAATFHDQVAQTAACNVSHTVEQRLARWLLLAHDRSMADTIPLTQDLLAMMLGTRRAGVSVAAGILKASGCIDYSRGAVTIKDRAALKAVACECYDTVRRRYDSARA